MNTVVCDKWYVVSKESSSAADHLPLITNHCLSALAGHGAERGGVSRVNTAGQLRRVIPAKAGIHGK